MLTIDDFPASPHTVIYVPGQISPAWIERHARTWLAGHALLEADGITLRGYIEMLGGVGNAAEAVAAAVSRMEHDYVTPAESARTLASLAVDREQLRSTS